MSEPRIECTELKRCDLIRLSGRFDSSHAKLVDETFQRLTDRGHFRFVLDMSKTDFISSGFLRVLVARQRQVKRWNRGDIYLTALSPRLQEVMKLAGLTQIFPIFDTVEAGVGAW